MMEGTRSDIAQKLLRLLLFIPGILGAAVVAYLISETGIAAAFLLMMLVPAGFFLYFLFRYPVIGLYSAFVFSFFAVGLSRYLPAPFGLLIDFLLFASVLLTLTRTPAAELKKLHALPFYVFTVWVVYTTAQLFNPQAPGFQGWFYAIRGTSYNFYFMIILGLLLTESKKHLQVFIYTWLAISLLAVLWGFKQRLLGPDAAEQAWLNAGNASTHVLRGKLRIFSFYSDAGQFGVAMAHAALVFFALALGRGINLSRRALFVMAGLLFFYSMAISGTRGALFVLAAGAPVYLAANRDFKLLVVGLLVLGSGYGMLRYTYIGQSNYEIQRLRSALNPEDASLNVRKKNQQILARYLADKPLGGGIGTSGYFGLRFSPNTLLAQTPTDSWYVRIWAETGIVGLILHVGGLLLLIIGGFVKVMGIHDTGLRNIMAALLAGSTGIIVASYGNSVIGQFPTNFVSMLSIVMVWKAALWDRRPEATTT